MSNPLRSSPLLSATLFPVLLAGLVIVPIIFRQQLVQLFSLGGELQVIVEQMGIWGVLGFIAAQMLQVIFFIIPGSALQISAGYLFGVLPGTLYSLIGVAIGTMISYLIGTGIGLPFMQRVTKEQTLDTISSTMNSPRAFTAAFLLFLIPGTPKDLFVFIAGALRMNFRALNIGSLLARTPAIIGSAIIGNSLFTERWVVVVVISSLSVVLFLLGILLYKPLRLRLATNSWSKG